MASPAQLYQYAVDPAAANTAAAHIMRFTGTDKTILELGAGPGSISRPLVELHHNRVTALEYDAESVTILQSFCDQAMQADLNDTAWPALVQDQKFDIIIAADVLEHLYDPWTTLKLATSLLAEGGSIIVSLPHAGHAVILGCLRANDFQYRGLGLLDRTHIRFFGMRNIQALFEDAGLKIAEYGFVTRRPEETEFAELWATIPAPTRTALSSGEFSHVYQTIIRAVPAAQSPSLTSHYLPACATPQTSPAYKPPKIPLPLRLAQWGHQTLQHLPAAHTTARRLYRALRKPV